MFKLKYLAGAVVLGGLAWAGLNQPTGIQGLFLIDKVGGQIRFFDPVTFKEQAAIPAPKNPHDFAISADHKFAYVPIYGDGIYNRNPHPGHEVLVVDLVKHSIAASIDVSPYKSLHGVQLGKSGLLYVAADESRKVLVIDTEGTGHWIALLPDESKLYVANKNDRLFVSVLDLKTRKMIGKIPAPNGTQGIASSPDGKMVVAVDNTEPVLLIIDPKTDTVTDRIRLKDHTGPSYKVYFSPDGKKLLTMTAKPQMMNILDTADLKGEQKTLPTGKDPMGFAFSEDGKTVLVANHGDGTVSVIDLVKNQVVRNFPAGTGIETLTYY
jgi:YVTN family beta-propeller protein